MCTYLIHVSYIFCLSASYPYICAVCLCFHLFFSCCGKEQNQWLKSKAVKDYIEKTKDVRNTELHTWITSVLLCTYIVPCGYRGYYWIISFIANCKRHTNLSLILFFFIAVITNDCLRNFRRINYTRFRYNFKFSFPFFSSFHSDSSVFSTCIL